MRTVHWLYCNSLLEDVISTEISCFNPNRKITVQFENKASDVCRTIYEKLHFIGQNWRKENGSMWVPIKINSSDYPK